MIDGLLWRVRRLAHFAHRSYGSVALRGWRGTLRRLWQERSRIYAALPAGRASAIASPATSPRPIRGRLLIVDSMTPDPQRDSGSMRLCHIFELLHQDGWQIDFFADDGYATADDRLRLEQLGVRIGQGSLLGWLRKHGAALDAVVLSRLANAVQYRAIVRRLAPRALLVFDTVDLHYVRETRAAEIAESARLRRRARHSRKNELEAIAGSDVTLVVSEEERMAIIRELPHSRVELLTNIHPLHMPSQGYAARKDLLFVGGFGHPPNADAVRWFVAEVLPLLRMQETGLNLHVVGDIDELSRRALHQPGVVMHGRVPDLTPLIDNCRVSVAPLRFGAGVKGKVNLAMSHGLPVVLTSIAAEGMHLSHGVNALIANEAVEFAAAVLQVYHDPALWQKLSAAGQDNIRRHFSVDLARHALRRVFAGVGWQSATESS